MSVLASETKSRRPIGLCCDTGAPKSVVGTKELNRIFSALGMHRRKLQGSHHRFRFADITFESRGRVSLTLRTPPGIPAVIVELDVVEADIPALLGMDILD